MQTHLGLVRWRSFLGVVGLALAASACSGGEAEPDFSHVVAELRSDEPRVVADTGEAQAASQSEQAFAFTFLHALGAEENLAFSPHSLSAAFAMLTDAAEGQTLAEVEQTLHFGQADEAFHRSQDALGLALAERNSPGDPDSTTTQILEESNDVWLRSDLPPEPSYLDTLARFYGAGVHQAAFGTAPEQVRQAINHQVSQDTHALIPEILPKDSISRDTVAVLTNALYFKARWPQKLSSARASFHALDGSSALADMLTTRAQLAYYAGDGFVSVAMPYARTTELELMLIVPDAGAYQDVRSKLSGDALASIVLERARTPVVLTLPKFDVKSTVPATDTFKALGMRIPFDPDGARFPKLVPEAGPNVYVSSVLHQATVAIDEMGTEASAATAIVTALTGSFEVEPPDPLIITVDRPFLFAIRDNPTGALLFLGQIVAP